MSTQLTVEETIKNLIDVIDNTEKLALDQMVKDFVEYINNKNSTDALENSSQRYFKIKAMAKTTRYGATHQRDELVKLLAQDIKRWENPTIGDK